MYEKFVIKICKRKKNELDLFSLTADVYCNDNLLKKEVKIEPFGFSQGVIADLKIGEKYTADLDCKGDYYIASTISSMPVSVIKKNEHSKNNGQ
jgi:hypothetical protein